MQIKNAIYKCAKRQISYEKSMLGETCCIFPSVFYVVDNTRNLYEKFLGITQVNYILLCSMNMILVALI